MMMLDMMMATLTGSLVMMASVTVLMAANSSNDASKQNIVAYTAARQVVDNLRLIKAARVAPGTYSAGYQADANALSLTQFGDIPQLAQLNNGSAQMVVTGRGNAMKQAMITISWESGALQVRRSRTLTALFAEGGVAP